MDFCANRILHASSVWCFLHSTANFIAWHELKAVRHRIAEVQRNMVGVELVVVLIEVVM